MCGICGFILGTIDGGNGLDFARRMADSIQHRGPDFDGYWQSGSGTGFLAHRRLAVIDISQAGAQPMISDRAKYVISFNGEIYNHLQLRAELKDVVWRGHSDTETLLAAFEAWGVEATLKKTVGMFAIALWDAETDTLTLARDRFGEKPLYYGWVGSGVNSAFVFGSELKALRAYPGFTNPVSREALALYMRFTYVPAPYSIYQNIFKLEPGCMLTIGSTAAPAAPAVPLRPPATLGGLVLHRWWALADVVTAGAQNQITDEAQALQALEDSLQTAVQQQSLADVPLGAFLSGGVDSSTIVALMQQQAKLNGSAPVKTFTVGFEEAGFDESPHARAVAKHLGTDHSEMFVTSAEALAVIPHLPSMYDEPFADSSQIPTHLVCKAARQQVTVALSGDAGDELFGGYNRYFWGPRIWSRLAWLPCPVRQTVSIALGRMPLEGLDGFGSLLGIVRPGEKLNKLAKSMHAVHNLEDLYRNLVSEWLDPSAVVIGSKGQVQEPPSMLADPLPAQGADQSQLRMMYRDSTTYLPDDILCKVDRAAMATSLETRVPFLDHRVAELAWRLPLNMKIRGNEGKWALRQVLYKYVPRELIERPKAGFGIPVGQWLRGPLRDWAESLLAENRLQAEGYFYPAPIRTKWVEHTSGLRDHTVSLWAVLMFQAWLEKEMN